MYTLLFSYDLLPYEIEPDQWTSCELMSDLIRIRKKKFQYVNTKDIFQAI